MEAAREFLGASIEGCSVVFSRLRRSTWLRRQVAAATRQFSGSRTHYIMREAFICDFVRTPIGRYGGVLSGVRTDDLAAHRSRS
jgi:hypothetical protein